MKQLAPKMKAFDSVRWMNSAADYPPSWEKSLRRLPV
jgi:hypothetical protein